MAQNFNNFLKLNFVKLSVCQKITFNEILFYTGIRSIWLNETDGKSVSVMWSPARTV